MKYPKIYLAIDNCFAYKRWTEPDAWAKVISNLGVKYIEASADTELDPLYMGPEYLKDWVLKVKKAEEKYGVKVANLYSGHGTYSTLGLTHTDKRVRDRMAEEWFKPMIDIATELDAGFGFYAHGFPEEVLQNRESYDFYQHELIQLVSSLNSYAAEKGCGKLGLEQMYVPFLIPWTISGTVELLKAVKRGSKKDFYFTEDLGHHHTKFIRPTKEQIKTAFAVNKRDIWLGSDRAFEIYDAAMAKGSLSEEEISQIEQEMEKGGRFFAETADSDCYTWLSRLGCYSPIIHLQQTDGKSSAHKSFTAEENAKGIIDGKKVLKALKESYDREPEEGMPEKCDEIYMTLELFSGTTMTSRYILDIYEETVQYWRQFIPEDGMYLDELLEGLE